MLLKAIKYDSSIECANKYFVGVNDPCLQLWTKRVANRGERTCDGLQKYVTKYGIHN